MKVSILLLVLLLSTIILGEYIIDRNVKDYGAKGDGVTDDSDAIIKALTEGRASDPNAKYPNAVYPSSTKRPAYVFFPSGTYLVKKSLPVVYYTQVVGDPFNPPVIKFVSTSEQEVPVLTSVGQWYPGHSQDNFYKQIRNFVVDMTDCKKCMGILWQVAQATSITNISFKMGAGSKNRGVFMGDGSGGFLADLTFDGGEFGMWVGNQQFTSRNISINGASIAGVFLNWDWAWEFTGLSIYNCPIGISMTGTPGWKPQGTGSLVLVDSVFQNCTVGIQSHFDRKSPLNTVVLDQVTFLPTGALVKNNDVVDLKAGGLIRSWVQGKIWQKGADVFDTMDLSSKVPPRPKSLTPGGTYYFQKSRPNFADSDMVNVVTQLGMKPDTDVTVQLNQALKDYANKKVLFFPHGTYLISDTIEIPAGSQLVGRVWSELMVTGDKFSNSSKPKAVLRVGQPGDVGVARLIDLLFTAKGPQPGAKFIEWNINDPQGAPGSCGMWDSHFRIGGADGTMISPSNCPKGDGERASEKDCAGIWAMMHVTKTGGLYMQNIWGWTADHDIDHADQLNVYTARGFLCESQGPVWMYGTAMEHNYLYQYNFVGAQNIMMALIQTETPYYQPSLKTPFTANHPTDPTFCTNDIRCKMSWALNIQNSSSIYVYGTGHYSFFSVWDLGCGYANPPKCQMEIVKVTDSKAIFTHALNTFGSLFMMTQQEEFSKAEQQGNVFCSTAAINLNLF